jgi:hypothetical protein
MKIFSWISTDLSPLISENTIRFAFELAGNVPSVTLRGNHTTSRESQPVELESSIVTETQLRVSIPEFVDNLYRGTILEIVRTLKNHTAYPASSGSHGVVLNYQKEGWRSECHVDSNPIAALLYLSSHDRDTGGELIVSNKGDVRGIDAVNSDCSVIQPKKGLLVIFDGRHHTHYVNKIVTGHKARLVLAMNYYTDECPFSSRPTGLDEHLEGRQQS